MAYHDTPTTADQVVAASARRESSGRMRAAGESYKTDRPIAMSKSGRPWSSPRFNQGKQLTLPSERDFAIIGALTRFRASRQLRGVDILLSEHETALIREAIETEPWSGDFDGEHHAEYRNPGRVKAILDSSTSGGAELNPVIFDQLVVTYPLLFGELTPYVDTQQLPRGSSVETAGIQTPTATWNEIAASIFPLMVGIELGRDILSDTPINLGQIVAGLIGERFQSELDNQIANGDGTTEPEGIFTASGVGTVASVNGTAGSITAGDIEGLVFGLPKQYRVNQWEPRFVSNDTMYARCCAVPVGTSDARRLFKPGMEHEDYTLMHRGVSIQQNISNGAVAFCALKKAYRLWVRQGVETRWSDQGATLMRANTSLLVVRARFGGKVIDPNAVCKCTDLDQSIAA